MKTSEVLRGKHHAAARVRSGRRVCDIEQVWKGRLNLAHIAQHDPHVFFEGRQVFLRDLPDRRNIYAHIIVNQHILPFQQRLEGPEVVLH